MAALVVALCCGLPVAWIVFQIVLNPTTLGELHFDAFRFALLGRTLLYNFSVGLLAVLLALPSAWVIGRGKGVVASVLGFVLPISLLMPSLVLAYGWKQVVRLAGWEFSLAGFWDVSRCVWSLATWLWPVPAIVVGLALRRSDPQVQQQALLDGVLWRVMLRQVAGPIIASLCVVSLLAMQEFAVYEPTGISVVATEIRMVFETGAYSSPTNPITQPMSGPSGFQQLENSASSLPDQRARAAASVATMLPLMATIGVLALIAWLTAGRLSATEQIDAGDWPRSLNVPVWAIVLSFITIAITLGTPMAGLVLSLKRSFDVLRWLNEFYPQMMGTLRIAGEAGLIAFVLALCASPRLGRGLIFGSLLSFLIGGQLLAIALIRLYNHPWLDWIYNGPPIMLMAYVARFGWIVLAAAGVTWTRPWRQLRDMAAIDGAGGMQTAKFVIWPLAWPIMGASAMFVTILSLSEVPATVLISPQNPPMLVPMLMTWLHMLRYDAMIEASLLMAAMVVVLGSAAIVLGWVGISRFQGKSKKAKGKSEYRKAALTFFSFCLLPFAFCLLLAGCDDHAKPQAVWCESGVGPAQVAFPRAIAYSKSDDSFYIADRQARIQHLDNHGRFIAGWRTPEWAQGKPVGLTVGPDGDLYVPDTHYHRVLVYSPKGELLKQWGSKGTDPGQFIYPTDIAFDSKGNIFVSEYGDNDRIQVFDRDAKFLYQFGKFGDGPGEFSRPQSIVIDHDLMYITDQCNHRIVVFKTDGTFVRNMCKLGSGLGELRFPYGMDEDSHGRLIVGEFGNNRVQMIDKETGKGLAVWGLPGHDPGEFAYTHGVAVDKNDRVVAVDAGNNRLQVFEF